jgi:predicted nucleic acid-binding protein
MHLFIDTNIFLSFYHFTSEDLEELNKLGVLLEQKKVRLYLPEQVVDEFRRNRENRIITALKQLQEPKLKLEYPQLCKDYEEYLTLKELLEECEKQRSILVDKIMKDVAKQTLKADETIQNLFEKATRISIDDKLVDKARVRMQVGNPPGKGGSLGDAINWETLLRDVPDGENLYFITDDKDYRSIVDRNNFREFLSQEWTEKKKSQIVYYERLSLFFQAHFPNIKLASELEKESLIGDLAASRSFAQTHTLVSKLSNYNDFTSEQLNEIVEAAISNNQIYWIIKDPDVYEFFTSIIRGHENQIDEDNLNMLMQELQNEDPE